VLRQARNWSSRRSTLSFSSEPSVVLSIESGICAATVRVSFRDAMPIGLRPDSSLGRFPRLERRR
jgi:hypothetical protein